MNPNGGTWKTFTSTQQYLLKNTEKVTISDQISRKGYTFKQWNLKGAGSTYDEDTHEFAMGIGPSELTAEWIVNSYTLSIDLDDTKEGIDETYNLDYDTSKIISNPTKKGYNFSHWTTTSGTIIENVGEDTWTFTMDDDDATLTAHWTPKSYSYTVYHNQMNPNGVGYTTIDNETETKTEEYNKTFKPPVKTFTGFDSPTPRDLTISDDVSLNIMNYDYDRHQRILTLNYGTGNTYTGANPGLMYYDTTVTLGIPIKKGYTFTNWTVDGEVLQDNIFVMKDEDKTATAHYTPISYSVTFNANGGTVTTDSKTVTYDSEYGTLPTPTWTGHTFDGWYTEVTSGTRITETDVLTVDSNQTLYAHWSLQTYTITFNLNGGNAWNTTTCNQVLNESICTKTVTYSRTYDTLPTPTRSGYTFQGWSTATSGGTTITASSTVNITSAQTLYAIWKSASTQTFTVTSSTHPDHENTASTTSACHYIRNYYGGWHYTPTTTTFSYNGYSNCQIVSPRCTMGTDSTVNTGTVFDCKYLAFTTDGDGLWLNLTDYDESGYISVSYQASCTTTITCSG